MDNQTTSMRAAIDVGSNTIHIVVARCMPNDLDIVANEVELVRIGESVTATGKISPQKRNEAIATLRKYKALAEQHSAETISIVATEAIRKATNSVDFLADVHRTTGLDIQVIDGDVEATLTFYGATYELAKQPNANAWLGVMDLGGGSTELVLAKNMHITWRTSIPVGSGWLHDRYLPSNPPTRDEVSIAQVFLQTYFQGVLLKRRPPILIATGGSANSLLHLAHHAFGLAIHKMRLTEEDILLCQGLLHALTAKSIAQRYKQPVGRTRILAAGVLIIRAMMERLQLREIFVTPHGIREGVLLAYARYGEQWLQYVKAITTQQGKQTSTTEHSDEEKQGPSFAQSGRRMLLERVDKLLNWRDDVLKHDDIEAVHKMRVASRRLRAVLDAYESICKPKQFKKVYRQIKQIADMLGKARDMDVMIQNLYGQLPQVSPAEQAGLQWLIDRLSAYRQQHQQELEVFFEKLDDNAVKKLVESCL